MLCNLSLLSSHASFILCERADGMFYSLALFNLILTPINQQVNLVNGLNGLLHFNDQWNSSRVSYKNGGFLLGYKQKIWKSSGMKINLYQNLQG